MKGGLVERRNDHSHYVHGEESWLVGTRAMRWDLRP